MKFLIAITGASGVIYGKRLLEILRDKKVDTHLIVSKSAELVIEHEMKNFDFKRISDYQYSFDDLTAPFSSGSFYIDAMIIVPASMKTIGALASGYCENLITRAADVQLKEGRKLILVPRETPLHIIHLENLTKCAKLGAVVLPAMPGFYHNPKNLEDLVDFIVGKILDQLRIKHCLYKRWT